MAINEDPFMGGHECEEIKYLCKEHLDLDVLISLPKPPPKRR